VEARDSGNQLDTNLYFRNTAPYAMANYTLIFSNRIHLTPSVGARYNFSEYFAEQLAYQGGMKLDLFDITVYGHYTHGFNLPGIYSAILFGGGPGGDAWKELEAETINHMEIGLTHHLGEYLRYYVSCFKDEVKNALRVVLPPPRYENIGEYTTQGVEISIHVSPLPALNFFIGGSYTQTTPEDAPYTPEWTGVVGANYQFADRAEIGLTYQYMDDYFTGNPRNPAANIAVASYSLLNLRVGYSLGEYIHSSLNSELFLAVENLLNTRYELKPGYPMPGTNVMLGLDMKI